MVLALLVVFPFLLPLVFSFPPLQTLFFFLFYKVRAIIWWFLLDLQAYLPLRPIFFYSLPLASSPTPRFLICLTFPLSPIGGDVSFVLSLVFLVRFHPLPDPPFSSPPSVPMCRTNFLLEIPTLYLSLLFPSIRHSNLLSHYHRRLFFFLVSPVRTFFTVFVTLGLSF